MNPLYKPKTKLIKMQEESTECSVERFLEIAEAYKDYYKFLSGFKPSGDLEEQKSVVREWIEMLSTISLDRFGKDLVAYPIIEVDQSTRDDYLIKYKITDKTRSIYYGIRTKEPITKFEADLWNKLSKNIPTQGQRLITYNNLRKKVL